MTRPIQMTPAAREAYATLHRECHAEASTLFANEKARARALRINVALAAFTFAGVFTAALVLFA